jgi:hypothetical protein
VERFSEMQADLDRERKAMTKLWAKPRSSSERCWTPLRRSPKDCGIAARAMQEIESLDILAIAAASEPSVV